MSWETIAVHYGLAMTTTDAPPQVLCPVCGVLDWHRDGFSVRADGPRIDLGREAPGSGADDSWACRRCGHQLDGGDPLAESLSMLQQAHWE
jgi:rubredoxin